MFINALTPISREAWLSINLIIAIFIIELTALDRRLTEANASINTSSNKRNNNNSRKPATGETSTRNRFNRLFIQVNKTRERKREK